MKYLYLDNFRGFQNANIPIRDVNFLVGENSTGKTSFLSVLKMFSSTRFLLGGGMEDEEALFGHFEEMVSAHSKDKSYFRLGMSDEFIDDNGKRRGQCWLLTYEKRDGLAQISRLTCRRKNKQIDLLFDEENIFRRITNAPKLGSDDDLSSCLLIWAEEHQVKRNRRWKKMPESLSDAPIFVLLSFATSELDKADSGDTFSFSLPIIGPPLVWIAPIRSKPRRTYDEPQTPYSSEGAHTPYLIRQMLSSNDKSKFNEFIQRVGSESGLFEKIEVKSLGASEISPFEVDAYLDDKALAITLMGYGVSQSLPIFVEILYRGEGSWFAIQQPEVHLHPRAQASLGDVFFEMALREEKRFIVETHSDFTIDRFRLKYRRSNSKKGKKLPDSQVLFFERRKKHNTVTPLVIDDNGCLPTDQPASYRDFFIREQMQMLGMD